MDGAVETQSQTGWQHELYDLLRENAITQIAYVPDAGHSILIDRSLADRSVHSIALTTEEEGVALIAGADLGGARAVLLMQSSGVGNCINSTARAPPRSAPAMSATPSSSVVSAMECTLRSASERSMRMLWPASGT